MKTNTQRAMERLTLTPNEEFLLKKDGFIGALYKPDKDEYPGKAVIMFGGSDMDAFEKTLAFWKEVW